MRNFNYILGQDAKTEYEEGLSIARGKWRSVAAPTNAHKAIADTTYLESEREFQNA